jgi:cell division protein FtsN
MRSMLLPTAILTALLMTGAPALTSAAQPKSDKSPKADKSQNQESAKNEQGGETRSQAKASAARKSSSPQKEGDTRRQPGGRSEKQLSAEQREALIHYRAGYLAGYRAGYVDSQDDYVLYIIDLQKKRQQGQEGSPRSLAEDRRRMRDEMRLGGRSSSQSGSPSQPRKSDSSSSGPLARSEQVRGEILRTKKLELRNSQREHLVVLMENDQGKRRIVDLGPSSDLKKIDLQEGDRITVQGRISRTADQVPVVLAQRLTANGKSVTIDRKTRSTTARGESDSRSSTTRSDRR